MTTLSVSQHEQFNEQGFVIVRGALVDADLLPLINEYSAYIDKRAKELLAAGRISHAHDDESFERRLALICEQAESIYSELDIMHLRGTAAFDFLRNDKLLDLVESIIGPEITCSPIQHIRPKLPAGLTPRGEDPHVVPWHQDAGVTWAEADPFEILTVWIPLTTVNQQNGCLQVLPGTHKVGLRTHETRRGVGTTIVKSELPNIKPLVLPMAKGDVLLMHKLLPHRSTRNVSDTVRWSVDLRYQKTGTPTGRPFHPHFVVRSRANPDAVLTDYDMWNQMWMEALEMSEGTRAHRWG